MREIVEICRQKGKVFSSLKPVEPKELKSRKKVHIYLGVDLKKYYTMIVYISKKSRILRKEVADFFELHARLERLNDSKIVKKCIIVDAPLCSKAKDLMEENGWTVVNMR